MNWENLLTGFDRQILNFIGHQYLPSRSNVITEKLREDQNFILDATERFGTAVNMSSMSRLATIAQMVVFDRVRGPEGDDKRKALRRHWYQWYKSHFAIPYSKQVGFEQDIQDTRWGINWAGRLSTTYAALVDNENVTYWDLWVEDGSRMIETHYEQLIHDANIVVCVEKDSLFPDFNQAAMRLGARVLISGKGKPSKAAAEKMLRDAFYFPKGRYVGYDNKRDCPIYENVITEERPLIVMSISDHDYDGHVIGASFAEQLRTYTPHILEVRVGIRPRDAEDAGYDLQDISYQIKISNRAYVEWAGDHAFFEVECANCNENVFVESAHYDADCPLCGMNVYWEEIKAGVNVDAFGFEVEAMRTADYYPLLVNALLRVLPFSSIVDTLRDETLADDEEATNRIVDEALNENPDFIAMQNEIERLQALMDEIKYDAYADHIGYATDHRGDFRDLGDEPEVEDFQHHVASNYTTSCWRPFSVYERTDALIELMRNELSDEIDDLKNLEIDWRND